jgi:hypothetical protein
MLHVTNPLHYAVLLHIPQDQRRIKMSTKVKKLTAGQKRARASREVIRRPGVITEIENILRKAGEQGRMVTTEQILTKLAKKFPDRDIAGMEVTVRAQLSRLPRERGLEITKERDGRLVRYAAAA